MKMSGTFLETINSGVRRLAAGPLATNRAWASSHRDLTKAKNLASSNVYTPTLKLRQFLENRKVARGEETSMHLTTVKNRGLEYNARRNYKGGDLDGTLSRRGQRAYEDQARNMQYQRSALRHSNNMDKGFGYRAKAGTAEQRRLDALDMMNLNASDLLNAEKARTEKIQYENAVGFHQRMEAAVNAHLDSVNAGKKGYVQHFKDLNSVEYNAALERYLSVKDVMEGSLQDTQYVAATAAQAYDTQAKIIASKMQKYFELTPPTADVVKRLKEFSTVNNAVEGIDTIISGMRILNQRGDTDLVKDILQDVLKISDGEKELKLDDYLEEIKKARNSKELEAALKKLDGGVELGTHASQSLASFLMFEVKGADPWLRRFGKYINLETAALFSGRRESEYSRVTYDEYLKGYYGTDENGKKTPKKNIDILMKGTSLDDVERTAYDNYNESLIEAYTYTDAEGNRIFDMEGYTARREKMRQAIGPQFVSANLKYVSGSEQMLSAIKFDMGYEMRKIEGEFDENGDPVYEYEAVWEKKKDGEYVYNEKQRAQLEEFYRKQAIADFFARTPSQYLASRTDEREPMGRHLLETYKKLHGNSEGLSDDEMIGLQTREELAKRNRLEQLGKIARRSPGSLAGSKSFVLDWAGLNDLDELDRFVKEYKAKNPPQDNPVQDDGADDAIYTGVYSDEDRARFVTEMGKVWEDCTRNKVPFYESSLEKLAKTFGSNGKIEELYADHYDDLYSDGRAPDEAELYRFLIELMSDPENYK